MDGQVTYDVCIVGAGLAGLAAAYRLHNAGLNIIVLEASNRTGGRIHSLRDPETHSPLADLGPSWIWPPYQKHASNWVSELGLELHPQYEAGMAVLDVEPNQPPRTEPMSNQQGISRLTGGPTSFIDEIEKHLPADCIRLNTSTTSLKQFGGGVMIETSNQSLPNVMANNVVVATPLRIAHEIIRFKNDLPDELEPILKNAPTWMAAQAKATILYDTAFWRELGLSGRIASRLGPMVEAHDLSGKDGSPAALFGFIGLPARIRANNKDKLKEAVVDQLVRCFGPEAENYKKLHIEDWAQNPFICTQSDLEGAGSHVTQLPEITRQAIWDQNLYFAVAETATQSPGLIDGALESAERISKSIINKMAPDQSDSTPVDTSSGN